MLRSASCLETKNFDDLLFKKIVHFYFLHKASSAELLGALWLFVDSL